VALFYAAALAWFCSAVDSVLGDLLNPAMTAGSLR
jgi:hypothetical protein